MDQIDIFQTLTAIRSRRKELKLRQRHVALAMKISVAAYSKIEKGLTALTLERLNEISEILQTHAKLLIKIDG